MVKFLCNIKGSGKTKKLISMANNDAKENNKNVVFIESRKKHIFDLNHNVRFISAMEFNIDNIECFHGFLCGIIAENYDIEKIYIDGLGKIVDLDFKLLNDLTHKLDFLCEKFDTDIIISISLDPEELPEELKSHIINN